MWRTTSSTVVAAADAGPHRLTATMPPSSQRFQSVDWSINVHGDDGRSCNSTLFEVSHVNSFVTGVEKSPIDEEHVEYGRCVAVRPAVKPSSPTSSAVDFSINRILNLGNPRSSVRPSKTTNVEEAVREAAESFNAQGEDDFGPVVDDRTRSLSDKNDDDSCNDDRSIAKSGGVRNRQHFSLPIGVPFLPGWLLVAGWPSQHQHHFGPKQQVYNQQKSTDGLSDSIDNYSMIEVRQQWRHAADARDRHMRRSTTPDSAEQFAAVDDDRRCSNESEICASTVNDRVAEQTSLIGRLPAEYDDNSSFHSENIRQTHHLHCSRSISALAPPGERKKKSRTVFSRGQIVRLESTFLCHRYPSSVDRCRLAADLQLSETQVKIWFQNRRNKWKRQLAIEMETAASVAEAAASTVTWSRPHIQSLMAITSALYPRNVHAAAATAAVTDNR